ncbi:MAG TPA: Hpt domain-containing protein, partial [Burkholderiales bacterium]|nr:Hpt domain-containing protein [Burkholderiales bacterium]
LDIALREAARACGGPRIAIEQAPPPVASAPVTSQLLDRERYEEIRMLTNEAGPNVFSGLVSRLEKDLNAFDAALVGWMAQQDATGFARAAHSLKGSSLSLGAQALGNLFADVEKLAKAGNLEDAGRKYSQGKDIGVASIAALNHAGPPA